MEKNQRNAILQERLIKFAVNISLLTEKLPKTPSGDYFAYQLSRSGHSSALNYGEARSAESAADLLHKMKIVLKKLRESFSSLMIIQGRNLIQDARQLEDCITECNELISIFVVSCQTATRNSKKR